MIDKKMLAQRELTEAQKEIRRIDGSIFYLEPFSVQFITKEYVSWLRNNHVNRYLLKPNHAITFQEAKRFCGEMINSEHDMFFAIILKNGKKHIGNVRLGPIDFESKNIKLAIMIGDSRFHNLGIGTEIVKRCSDFCFYKLGMRKLFLEVIDENKAAIRIYEKNGFQTEGLLKNHFLCNGKPVNILIMSLFNEEPDTLLCEQEEGFIYDPTPAESLCT